MDDDKVKLQDEEEKLPDDSGGLNIRGHLKIYDPETTEIFVINNDA